MIADANMLIFTDGKDNSKLISYRRNKVWAIAGEGCEGKFDLRWQGGREDLNDDGVVDFKDVALLSQDWLKCSDGSNPYCTGGMYVVLERPYYGDINKDKYTDFVDLSIMLDRWLAGY